MEFFDKRTQELLDCLLSPDESAPMDTQKVAVIDQLLEHVEVSVRTICDLIRFKCMKSAGMIQSMDEFLELYYDREQFIRCMEAWGGAASNGRRGTSTSPIPLRRICAARTANSLTRRSCGKIWSTTLRWAVMNTWRPAKNCGSLVNWSQRWMM